MHIITVVHTQVDRTFEDAVIRSEKQFTHIDIQLIRQYTRHIIDKSAPVDTTESDSCIEE